MTISNRWLSSLAAAVASLFYVSANAADSVDPRAPSRTVKVWDLDLAKSADVQTFHERVRAAANDVCSTEARRHWLSTRRVVPTGWVDRCVTDAVEAAVREVGNRRLAINTLTGSRPLL
jgi:UrcA family protein